GAARAVPGGVPGVLQQGAAAHLPAEPCAGGTVLECEEDPAKSKAKIKKEVSQKWWYKVLHLL
ncbi:MAG: hypothetical protein K9W43_10175, partial [Candidatus Thorarchaeota archaeon]|nr:hypothetical protein [Candidatus Thorarchaeota archaeon]